ncbi:activating transcription factor 7-interacting protein 1 isoform X2 [Nasonia vitripennis]|uniref:Stathmin n=2 Tax=Nasonia vitripennis TaxID=7425 RepID=A0A7M7HAT8_NASVI|nr:activating transcription factor 7-interacting protein 1 isoform X2 [Nasonia vitripennis]
MDKQKSSMATAAERLVENEATEIRCQEKTKGGLRYEVILAEPTAPAKRAPSPTQTSPTQPAVNIEDKLRAAEERRLSLEASKIAALNARLSKIEEVARKKDELNASFVNATRESLDIKMNNSEEKREAFITDLRSKLKEHLEGVEKTRLTIEQQTEEVRVAIDEKLKNASGKRGENIKSIVERLKEHEERVATVRQGIADRVLQLESQIQSKLDQARERRELIEREQKEKLRNHNTVRLAKVRDVAGANVARDVEAIKRESDARLISAELNRQREIQRRVQAIRQHEKRVEMVRQNKAKVQTKEGQDGIMDNMPVVNETASSG